MSEGTLVRDVDHRDSAGDCYIGDRTLATVASPAQRPSKEDKDCGNDGIHQNDGYNDSYTTSYAADQEFEDDTCDEDCFSVTTINNRGSYSYFSHVSVSERRRLYEETNGSNGTMHTE